LTAGAALEAGLITDETHLRPCYGGMRFGNRYFKCWDAKGHGSLTVYHALEQSCDVFFYQVGQILGVDTWGKYASKCGFGKKVGIDIPGEQNGISPSIPYYNKVYGKKGWSKLLVVNLAIGQGEFTVTPLQLAQLYSGIANNGVVFRPHLLKETLNPEGTSTPTQPEVSFRLPFSGQTIAILRAGLELVVQGDRGTARGQRSKNYKVSGKTGTAQNPHGKDHSWFVGYAPSEDPRIVVCAIVENAGHGSEVAAPLVSKVIKQYLMPEPEPPIVKSADSAKIQRP